MLDMFHYYKIYDYNKMKVNRKTFLDKNKQKELIKISNNERAYIEGEIPITGRTKENYSVHIFPDIKDILSHLKEKDYLDIACGINHEYPESLLRKLTGNKKRHGLDIHNKDTQLGKVKYFNRSIYQTGFKNNSYDCITINNFLYFWESKPTNLLTIFKELYRILKKDGEIRIFPVYYGNYHLENIELHSYLNEHFNIRCLFPKKDYSKESPIYIENGEIKQTNKGNGINEYRLNHKLMSMVFILKKI